MHEEDMRSVKQVEEILEKELRSEMKKIIDAGSFVPGQTKTLSEAVCLMLKMKEYEEWINGEGVSEYAQRNMSRMSYAQPRSSITGRFTSRGMEQPYSYRDNAYGYSRSPYDMGYSGHSTKDRMIAALEDVMGEAKNDYEMQMVRDVIGRIESGK